MLKNLANRIIGSKLGRTRIVPITSKIVFFFIIFLLTSNFITNYINLIFNRTILINEMKELLIKDLKEMHVYCNNQREIYNFNGDLDASKKMLEKKALHEMKKKKSVTLGVTSDGVLHFQASRLPRAESFTDSDALEKIIKNRQAKSDEGYINFIFNNEKYFGVYKYNSQWDLFVIRAEELNEFYEKSRHVFYTVSVIILLITTACSLMGIFVLHHILRFVRQITGSILKMTQSQQLGLIELPGAANDEITFLGMAFNSLSSTISNLVGIFRKFANKDVAAKAYRDKIIRLEGTQKELTCLFSDIKGFTYMTEILGTDIITVLNMHYDKAIREILNRDGIIGSIIGDALLAVFGALDEASENKSLQAILSAYKIQDVAENLRMQMHEKKEEIVKTRGALTEQEKAVYRAVLIEVGVGIDGGTVFYGNIGSDERMTNTVIGDNVNSASRLEGLTRVYKVPVICSEYVKNDIEKNVKKHNIVFTELDIVQVKGKTIGKKIYWPVPENLLSADFSQQIDYFSAGLADYYKGAWKAAAKNFARCNLPLADEFKDRTGNRCPKGWNGIWTMTTK